MLFKLAWRNIWRNQTRTFITMAAIFLAVILSTLMMSLKEGVYSNMIDSMIGSYTGYVQVHANGYWDEKTLDNSLVFNNELAEKISSSPGVISYVPRIESFALAASDSLTKASMVVGIDPKMEREVNKLHERVSEGEYLDGDDKAVMVGVGLAEALKVGIGDTLVLIGSGYHGASAAGKYVIKSLIKFGSPDLSKRLVFLPIKEAQYMYAVDGMFTNIILEIEDNDEAASIANTLGVSLGDEFEVMDWKELTPELLNMIETDRVEGYVFMFILYMVISFGIFGTMLMMLAERQHEFGVLVAVGMKRFKLAQVVWMEMVNMSFLGALAGIAGAFPVCLYFYLNPIRFGDEIGDMYEEFGMEPVMQASIEPGLFIQQAFIIFVIASMIAIYPLIKLSRMNAIKSMRS